MIRHFNEKNWLRLRYALLVVSFLVLFLFVHSCTDSLTDVGNDSSGTMGLLDTIPPPTVTDLQIIYVDTTSCLLEWSSSADAEKYSLRYHMDTLYEQLWDSAHIVSDEIKVASDVVRIGVNDLKPENFYCFAVKACDTAGNWSGISNIVCCSTLALPDTVDTTSPPTRDTIPPGRVSDLFVFEGYYEFPRLSFTVPYDDSSVYLCVVRISSTSDFSSYDSLVLYSLVSGDAETVEVRSGYVVGEVQFAEVVCLDWPGNVSEPSNIVKFKQIYQIKASSCIACGRCARACPNGAISYSGGVYIIDPLACEGCAICVSRCPTGAIHKFVKRFW